MEPNDVAILLVWQTYMEGLREWEIRSCTRIPVTIRPRLIPQMQASTAAPVKPSGSVFPGTLTLRLGYRSSIQSPSYQVPTRYMRRSLHQGPLSGMPQNLLGLPQRIEEETMRLWPIVPGSIWMAYRCCLEALGEWASLVSRASDVAPSALLFHSLCVSCIRSWSLLASYTLLVPAT
jgi:hypothetical protein